jgi:hypothetical protein
MLFLYNQTFTSKDLKSCQFEIHNRQIDLIKHDVKIEKVHPYVLSFFKYKKIIRERPYFNEPKILKNILQNDIDLAQEEFDMFIRDHFFKDQENLRKLQQLLKMNLKADFKTIKNHIIKYNIEAYLDSTQRDRVLIIFEDEFLFKNWSYDGAPYFKDWLKKKELYFLNCLIEYVYI